MSKNMLNLNPAIIPELEDVLYPEEFQEHVSAWFEKQGVITDLRTQLRHHLINVIRNTTDPVRPEEIPSLPFRIQAVNLLIAEYLLKNKYYHSLSVLSMEVPLPQLVTEFKGLEMAKLTKLNDKLRQKQFRFSETKFWDILTIFGYPISSIGGKTIYNSYFNHTDEPLILHIIDFLSSQKDFDCDSLSFSSDTENIGTETNQLIKTFQKILLKFDIPKNTSLYLIEYLKKITARLEKNIKTAELQKFNELQSEIQQNIEQKETKIEYIIMELENNFSIEKQNLIDVLNIEKEQYLGDIGRKKTELENQIESVRTRECLLEQREKNMLEKEIQNSNSITEANSRLKEENSRLKEELLEEKEKFNSLQKKYLCLKQDLQQTRKTVDTLMNESDHEDSIEEVLKETKQRLERLKIETQHLDQSFKSYKLRQIQNE